MEGRVLLKSLKPYSSAEQADDDFYWHRAIILILTSLIKKGFRIMPTIEGNGFFWWWWKKRERGLPDDGE
jgi:hypothetical protein